MTKSTVVTSGGTHQNSREPALMDIEKEGLLEEPSSDSGEGVHYHGAEVPRSSLWGNFVTAVKYVWADTKKNTKSFVIGCITVAIVVFSLR